MEATILLAGSSFFSLSYGLAAATVTTAVAAETTITTTAVAAAAAKETLINTFLPFFKMFMSN